MEHGDETADDDDQYFCHKYTHVRGVAQEAKQRVAVGQMVGFLRKQSQGSIVIAKLVNIVEI